MKIYRFWALAQDNPYVESLKSNIPISCWGGSNRSEDEAKAQGQKKISLVVEKINGNESSLEDYTVEIKEKIIKEIDAKNIITRNRYGALVLNCEDTVFLDIDQPKLGFLDLFKTFTLKQRKQKMLSQIKEAAKKFPDTSFRVYETRKGYRIIVISEKLGVHSKKVKEFFQEFHTDEIYTKLCLKQDCFRARITPKPSYIKHKGRRFKFPMINESEEEKQWIQSYDSASKSFSICHLVEQLGPSCHIDEVIHEHDRYCRVKEDYPLG